MKASIAFGIYPHIKQQFPISIELTANFGKRTFALDKIIIVCEHITACIIRRVNVNHLDFAEVGFL